MRTGLYKVIKLHGFTKINFRCELHYPENPQKKLTHLKNYMPNIMHDCKNMAYICLYL